MRGKKVVINTAMSLVEEIVAVICGFILPRLILSCFGSKYNGLTTSITQFLACAVLLRSGIGGATRAALYKPLAEKNKNEVDSIIKATDIFMKKIGLILAGGIVIFAAIYPFFVADEFDWFFTFSLFVIIGASTFAESFFGITYLILLQADQRLWVSSLLRSVCYILNTTLSAVLMIWGSSIHIVKLGSAFVYVLYPILLGFYVKRKYKIDKNVKPDNKAIAQRWDALWHQVSAFIMNNSSIMILTAFTNMLEVSVYSVYNLVFNGLKRAVTSFLNGLEAAFGNMIAKKESDSLRENVSVIEFIIYAISTVIYTSACLLILDFVRIYTGGITDVNYIRPVFAYVIIIAQFFNGIRLPYQLVVQAAGHYKQTKKGAMIEAIINIVLSVILVFNFGLIGVAVGTLAATVFRTVQYSIYMSKHIVSRSYFITLFRCIVAFAESAAVIVIINVLGFNSSSDYIQWIFNSIAVVGISCVVVVIGSFVFFRKDVVRLLNKMKSIFKKKQR